jgi:single-stranded-DNA-specific exonuclease
VKSYKLREPISSEVSEKLKGYPELQRSLLFYRGIDDAIKAEEYLNPNYEKHIHDPFLMKDMDKAVERILKAIDNQERILIYSDYDADGIPAAVVMMDFFKLIKYDNVEVYIPHRHNEGYGLHLEALDTFPEKGIKLLITLDCGIVDHAEVAHAQLLGIDVIVTDHHLPGETLPPAYAVVNPKRADCEYPYKMKCGAGVGFKLATALLQKGNFGVSAGAEKWLLDMVGIATLSDMVPLQGENRVLAHYGLKVLRKSRRPGFQKMLKLMKVDQRYITEDDVGFMITPRINAASRMGIPMDAYKVLSTSDEAEGDMLAKHLDAINNERKGLVASTIKEIKKIMAEREDHFKTRNVIVLGNPSWRPALLGLAANTIAEEYNKPVFLWGREDGKEIKGSCRSDGVTHLVKLMNEVKEYFHEYGGHSFSGGYAVIAEKIHTFEDALHDAYTALGNQAAEVEPNYVDAKLSIDDITPKLAREIDLLAPFGKDNPKPVFMFENVSPAEVKLFGKTKDHLELAFYNAQNRKVRAIGFFMKPEDFASQPKKGIPLTLIGSIEKSYFGGTQEIRLRIVDIL